MPEPRPAPPPAPLRCGDRTLELGGHTYIMGILNVTDDSFSGDGLLGDPTTLLWRAQQFVADGADILDVGGESARADVRALTPDEEIARVVPAIERLAREVDAVISIDSYKPEVVEAAVQAGARLINDIGGFRLGTGTADVAARCGVPLVINYTYERPKVRPSAPPLYADLIGEHVAFFQSRIERAVAAGVERSQLVLDPGIAFGKSHDEDLTVLRELRRFTGFGLPLLVAASRKHLIGSVLGLRPEERLEGTAAIIALSIANGADIVRVHDVRAMARVARMADALVRGRPGDFAASAESWPWAAGAAIIPGTTIRRV
ncbi:MAG TPA: dihydropteroate synthase [Dehalococcoidia bacterium]|nr:dihydropteroate synthase [Dehalococcoidia bacterium]